MKNYRLSKDAQEISSTIDSLIAEIEELEDENEKQKNKIEELEGEI